MYRFLLTFSSKRILLSVNTAVWIFASKNEKTIAFDKVEAALCLIRDNAPTRLHQIYHDIEIIFVAGNSSFLGQYIQEIATIELYDSYVISNETSVASLASTLVHEAQHARLIRLGFGYDEKVRGRIERLCFKAERNFGKLLPSGEEVIERAEEWLNSDVDSHFTSNARLEAKISTLEELELPKWMRNIFIWLIRWRSA